MKFEYLYKELEWLEGFLKRRQQEKDNLETEQDKRIFDMYEIDPIKVDIYHLKKRIESLSTPEGLKVEIEKMKKQYDRAIEYQNNYKGKKKRKEIEDKEITPVLNAIKELKAELNNM